MQNFLTLFGDIQIKGKKKDLLAEEALRRQMVSKQVFIFLYSHS